MIPIHEPGKAKTEATSYRPISLTSCVVKLLERIINTRLKWCLETEKLLVPQQVGFREHQCTEDQTTYLPHEIEDGFQRKNKHFQCGLIYKNHSIKYGQTGFC